MSWIVTISGINDRKGALCVIKVEIWYIFSIAPMTQLGALFVLRLNIAAKYFIDCDHYFLQMMIFSVRLN